MKTDVKESPDFDGHDYQSELDKVRLTGQMKRVYDLMKDGRRRNLAQIAARTGDPEGSISAQLRNLRKIRFGGHDVRKERVGNPMSGMYVYWIEVPDNGQLDLEL